MAKSISSENAAYLSEAIRSGAYRDEGEALDEAIYLLKKRDQLRAEVRAGIDQANRDELLPADKVFERLAARAQQIEQAAGAARAVGELHVGGRRELRMLSDPLRLEESPAPVL